MSEEEALKHLDNIFTYMLIEKELGKEYEIATKTLIQKNKEKDKIIDRMARAWKQDDVRKIEEIKNYFKGEIHMSKELEQAIDELIAEMRKNGSNYWADRIEKIKLQST